MLLVGAAASFAVSHLASRAAIENAASATALFLDSIVTPLAQPLTGRNTLPAKEAGRLEDIFADVRLGERFPHLDIWMPDGLVAFSRTASLTGRRFPLPDGVRRAGTGEVVANFADLSAGEHRHRAWTTRYLEVYVPVRENDTGRIIAVAEIHEIAGPLYERLGALRWKTWGIILTTTLIVMAGLTGIVHRGGRLIERQQVRLRRNIDEIKRVSLENRKLGERLQQASERVTETNEATLRHIAAELHDGPAQLLSLASLKVEIIRRARDDLTRERELQVMETTLHDAIGEIRELSKGLMLPEIRHLSIAEIVARAVERHEKRTGTAVDVVLPPFPACTVHAMKLCVYRFLQEGLNNAFRHARGQGQAVRARIERDYLMLSVEDAGSGGAPSRDQAREGRGLGLAGLKGRIESLGGRFLVLHGERGTRLEMRLPLCRLAPSRQAGFSSRAPEKELPRKDVAMLLAGE